MEHMQIGTVTLIDLLRKLATLSYISVIIYINIYIFLLLRHFFCSPFQCILTLI